MTSTEVKDLPGGAGTTDVFVAHRKQILAASAPGGAVFDEPEPVMPADADTSTTADTEPPHEDTSAQPEDLPDASSSAGYLQFPSPDDEDDDLLDDEDDDDDQDLPQGSQHSAGPRFLPQQLSNIDWKSPKVLIGALSTVVLIAVLIVTFKPRPDTPPPLTISPAPPPTSAAPPPAPVDGPIKIESAISKCPAGSSPEANAFDGQNDTAWTCKMPYGPGQILTINLGEPHVISGVSMIPGFNKFSTSGDEWTKYHTVTRVRWLFGTYNPAKPCTLDNNCLQQNTNNTRDVVSVPVVPNKTASTVKLVILKTTPPPSDSGLLSEPNAEADSFAISDIQIIGHLAK